MAEKGVVVYQKNGTTTFFPAENIEKIEFVYESYEPARFIMTLMIFI